MRAYTDEQLRFIYDHRDMFRKDLATAFNRAFNTNKSEIAIKSLCSKKGWNTGRPKGLPKGLAPRKYTDEQLRFLSENRTMPRAELTIKFNQEFKTQKSVIAICAICKREGIKTGRDGRFKKGNIPFTAGTKGFVKPNSGSFQKGHSQTEKKPIGAERICSKDGYILVKVAQPNVWKHKHKVVWEDAYGPIKDDEVITFRDGNILNVSLDNLLKITRRELLWLNQNGYRDTPSEFLDTLRALARMNVKAQKLARKNSKEEQ